MIKKQRRNTLPTLCPDSVDILETETETQTQTETRQRPETETDTFTETVAFEEKAVAAPKHAVITAPDPNSPPAGSKFFGGSNFDDFNQILMNQAMKALWTAHSDPESREIQFQAAFGAMIGLKPQDEAEGMLIAQMIACHAAAMECFRRAMLKEQSLEGRRQSLNFGNKLCRTYALHLETLNKHRGKGQQKVTVEHVHVHQGGQAIVGDVHTRTGVSTRSEDQAHAITHSHEPEMRSAFTEEREAMPITSDEKR